MQERCYSMKDERGKKCIGMKVAYTIDRKDEIALPQVNI